MNSGDSWQPWKGPPIRPHCHGTTFGGPTQVSLQRVAGKRKKVTCGGAVTAVEQLRFRVLRPRAVCTCLPPHLTPTSQEAARAGAWMETGARFSMYW